jgi:hypothetical protein
LLAYNRSELLGQWGTYTIAIILNLGNPHFLKGLGSFARETTTRGWFLLLLWLLLAGTLLEVGTCFEQVEVGRKTHEEAENQGVGFHDHQALDLLDRARSLLLGHPDDQAVGDVVSDLHR